MTTATHDACYSYKKTFPFLAPCIWKLELQEFTRFFEHWRQGWWKKEAVLLSGITKPYIKMAWGILSNKISDINHRMTFPLAKWLNGRLYCTQNILQVYKQTQSCAECIEMYSYLKKHLELDQKIPGKLWFLTAFKETWSSRKVFSSSPVRKSMERFKLLIRQNNLPDGIIIFIKKYSHFIGKQEWLIRNYFLATFSTFSINENST